MQLIKKFLFLSKLTTFSSYFCCFSKYFTDYFFELVSGNTIPSTLLKRLPSLGGIIFYLTSISAAAAPPQDFREGQRETLQFIRAEAITQGTLLQIQKLSSIQEDIRVPLFDSHYIKGIPYDDETTFLLLNAMPCENCKEERAIYLVRLTGFFSSKQKEKNTKVVTHFVQPGKVSDSKTGEVLLDSRAFFGQCLPQSKEFIYISFQKEKIDKKKKYRQAVYIATLEAQSLNEKIIEKKLPSLQKTLNQVKSKQCQEVPSRNRIMLQKPLDLKTRNFDDIPELDEPNTES